MKILKKLNLTFTIIALVLLLAVCSYIYILFDAGKELDKQSKTHLDNLTTELGNLVTAKIEERFTTLEVISYIATDSSYGSNGQEKAFLDEYASKEGMVKIEILSSEEAGNYNNNAIVNETDEDGNRFVCMYVPIYLTGGTDSYVIKGTYEAAAFSKIVSAEMLGQSKNMFLVSRSGEIVASGNNQYELGMLFGKDNSYAKTLKSHIASRKKGHITYSVDNNERYICYANVSYNNWYIVTIVSSNLVEDNYAEVNKRGVILAIILFLVILFLSAYIIYFNKKYHYYKNIFKESKKGEKN